MGQKRRSSNLIKEKFRTKQGKREMKTSPKK
jgi:hypothetical protein